MTRSKSTSSNLILKILFSIAIFVSTINIAFCQSEGEFYKVPNYDTLNVNIHSKSSANFYPDIFKRYVEGDTTLTLDNYHHLYYGYSMQIKYSPLKVNPMEDSLMLVMQKNVDRDLISPDLFEDVKRITFKSLDVNPFDLQVLNMLAYIYYISGDSIMAKSYSDKVTKIKSVILASGDGLSKHNPFHVISRAEEDAMIGALALKVTKRSYITIDVEYLHLEERFEGKKGVYFDISRMWTVELPEKKPARKRFEINPLYNPKSNQYIGPR